MYMPTYPDKPYEITKGIWESFYGTQQRGSMNMYGHHYIGYLSQTDSNGEDAYNLAKQWFEEEGNTEPLVIE